MRDDFLQPTIRILADRVNSTCSSPGCRAATRGPRSRSDKAANIGVACHIVAASPDGGPRADASLTSEERSHFNNGIWLCENCAKLIDTDTERYTTELLKQWKQEAEQAALQELGRPRGFSKGKLAVISS